MKKIVLANKKGGVSKTSTAVIMALKLAQKYKVLLIDTDSQNALTSFFFEDYSKIQNKTIYEAIENKVLFEDCIFQINKNLDVVPSKPEWENINFDQIPGKELFLKLELESANYDYVIIDTAPNTLTETVVALACADIIIIPVQLQKMDVRGVSMTLKKIDEVKRTLNTTLKGIYILPTQYDYKNRTVNDLNLETLQELYPNQLLDIIIKSQSQISQLMEIGYDETAKLENFEEYQKLIEVIK